jgi:hypothetical protein
MLMPRPRAPTTEAYIEKRDQESFRAHCRKAKLEKKQDRQRAAKIKANRQKQAKDRETRCSEAWRRHVSDKVYETGELASGVTQHALNELEMQEEEQEFRRAWFKENDRATAAHAAERRRQPAARASGDSRRNTRTRPRRHASSPTGTHTTNACAEKSVMISASV